MNRLRTHLQRNHESAFTLIELIIVIVIVALLASVAVVVFSEQQKAAVAASVASDARNTHAVVQTALNRTPRAEGFVVIGPGDTPVYAFISLLGLPTADVPIPEGYAAVHATVSRNNVVVIVDPEDAGHGALNANSDGAWDGYVIHAENPDTNFWYEFDSTTGQYRSSDDVPLTDGELPPGGSGPQVPNPTDPQALGVLLWDDQAARTIKWVGTAPECSSTEQNLNNITATVYDTAKNAYAHLYPNVNPSPATHVRASEDDKYPTLMDACQAHAYYTGIMDALEDAGITDVFANFRWNTGKTAFEWNGSTPSCTSGNFLTQYNAGANASNGLKASYNGGWFTYFDPSTLDSQTICHRYGYFYNITH